MLSSIRRGLLLTTVFITILSALSAFIVFATIQHMDLRDSVRERALQQASSLAVLAAQQLDDDRQSWMERYQNLLENNSFILNTHVYRYDSAGELQFYTSYNRAGTPPIASRPEQLPNLHTPQLMEQGIDVAVPIRSRDELLGYVFLRAHIEDLRSHLQLAAFSAFVVLIIAIVLSLLMAGLLSGYFTRPLQQLIQTTQEIARTRDYSLRVKPLHFVELNILAQNFNMVLERVEQYLNQREKAQRMADQLNADLESQVEQRTTALRHANQELLDTLEQLHQHQGRQVEVQKMSSLSELVAGISHEINTPIGLAVTAASMLQETLAKMPAKADAKTAEQAQGHLKIVQRNLSRSVELINNFKKLAIEHAGEDPSEVQLAQLFEDIVTSARAYITQSNKAEVNVICDIDYPVLVKVGVWQQLISSLLENSVIHGFANMTHGHVTIHLYEEDGQLTLHYRDNGVGVPADILRRIFDPFVTSKRGSGNSGLGMHLVYNLVTHTLNGNIHCQSQPDKGFEVIITCPLRAANER